MLLAVAAPLRVQQADAWPRQPVKIIVPFAPGGATDVLALDESIPNGTYVAMFSKLSCVDPAAVNVLTLILRGEYDGIASYPDVAALLSACPTWTSSSPCWRVWDTAGCRAAVAMSCFMCCTDSLRSRRCGEAHCAEGAAAFALAKRGLTNRKSTGEHHLKRTMRAYRET